MRSSTLSRYGLELYNELVERLASENQLALASKEALLRQVQKALVSGVLISHDPQTTARILDPRKASPYVTVKDFNSWLSETGSMLPALSTLNRGPRNPRVLRSQWEGLSATDFEEEKRRLGSFAEAAKAHGVSRQAYTAAYYRAVGITVRPQRGRQQGAGNWAQGLAQGRKK
jgi:hypothetical protein